MAVRGGEILTKEQRLEFTSLPDDLSEEEIAAYYTLSRSDIDIINRHRRDHNRLGFALQLCVLRHPGWSLSIVKEIPQKILDYIAKQIDVDPDIYKLYRQREATVQEHMDEIRQEYAYKVFGKQESSFLSEILLNSAMENGNSMYLINMAITVLRRNKIILPGMSTIELAVWEARKAAEEKIFSLINNCITDNQKIKLEELLTSKVENNKTRLAWLKETPTSHSPESFIKVIDRLEYVKQLNLNINTSNLHHNRLIQLSRMGEKYETQALQRFNVSKRYAILVIYLLELSQSLIDYAIEIHDRQMMNLESNGRRQQDEMQKQNGKALNEKIIHFSNLVRALLKAKSEGLDPYTTIEISVMPWDKLVTSGQEAEKLARPIDYDYIDLIDNKYSNLRKYTPTFLKCLEFKATKSNESLLKAVNLLNDLNNTKKRNVPFDAPTNFLANRWNKYVFEEDGSINRRYYEMAVLTELKNSIRSEDVSVVGSKKHKDFDEYLVSKDEWESIKVTNSKLAVSNNFEDYIQERRDTHLQRIKWVNENIQSLEGVTLLNGEIHVKRLEKNTPDGAKEYSKSIYELLPKIKLTNLLMEVANWTGFEEQFTHASTGKAPKGDEKDILMATLIAMGTNIGLSKMADSTDGISYYQMANTAQWRLYDDALNRAQAVLVNFLHKQSLPYYWGDGSTSSSDGMRVITAVSSLHGEHNPHYGSGKGATIYRFISDQYSAFYTKVINTNARDAVHVIDGLLHHETDLDIKEHYTDTDGFTEQTFGLCHLLGFRFAPRLRDISDAKLYSFDRPLEFQRLEKILKAKVNTKIIKENYDDVLRLAHSIRAGKVSASLIMGKLGSYSRQNSLAFALKEMGRIEKTIFILDYISNEELRRRIQKGLNKGEAANALARAIFFAKRGEFHERDIQDQLQRASALNIVMNAITVWNTVYLSKAVEYLRERNELKENMLSYVSPLNWEHINLYGHYSFDKRKITTLEDLLPLNIKLD